MPQNYSLEGWEWNPFAMGSGWKRVWKRMMKQSSKSAASQGGGDEPLPPEEPAKEELSPKDKMAEVLKDVIISEPEAIPPARYGSCSTCCISVDASVFQGRCSVCGRSLSFR